MELVIVAQRALPCLRWQGGNVSFGQAPKLLACFQERVRAAERRKRDAGRLYGRFDGAPQQILREISRVGTVERQRNERTKKTEGCFSVSWARQICLG